MSVVASEGTGGIGTNKLKRNQTFFAAIGQPFASPTDIAFCDDAFCFVGIKLGASYRCETETRNVLAHPNHHLTHIGMKLQPFGFTDPAAAHPG